MLILKVFCVGYMRKKILLNCLIKDKKIKNE